MNGLGADVDHSISHGGRGLGRDYASGPQQGTRAGVQRVQCSFDVAEINHGIRHRGKGRHLQAGGVARSRAPVLALSAYTLPSP